MGEWDFYLYNTAVNGEVVTGPLGTVGTSSGNTGFNTLANPGTLGTTGYTLASSDPSVLPVDIPVGGVGGTSMANVVDDLLLTGY